MSKKFIPAYTEDKMLEAIDKIRETYWWKKHKQKKHLKD